MTRVPTPSITRIDSSDKKSYISVKFAETYQIDKIDLNISGSKYYRRSISFYNVDNKNSFEEQFTLSSNSPPSFQLQIKAKAIVAIIDNGDNPPLTIAAVTAWQLDKYLLAYLEKGESYHVSFGNNNTAAPEYDLGFFADSIPPNVPAITPGKIEALPLSTPAKKPDDITKPVILWIVIIGVLLLLLFASYKLAGDLERKKKEKNGIE